MAITQAPPATWLFGCFACGYDLLLRRSLDVVPQLREGERVGSEPCTRCQQLIDTGYDVGDRESVILDCLPRLMDWCPCGDPDQTTAFVMRYLDHLDRRGPGTPQQWLIEASGGWVALHVIANLADGLGWTDHGGSILSAWLTETGRAALDRYRCALLLALLTPEPMTRS